MKMVRLIIIACFVLSATISAQAAWQKSYDWDDSKDQTWTQFVENSKNYISNGDWTFEYGTYEDGIHPYYVRTTGTNGLINFDTVERDTGLVIRALAGCDRKSVITEVIFPASLKKIDDRCFRETSLTGDLIFPGTNPMRLGDSAFAYCAGITSIRLPNIGTILDNWSLGRTSGLTKADLSGVVSIGDSALTGLTHNPLDEVILTACVTNIGASAFKSMRKPTYSIAMPPEGMRPLDVPCRIGAEAFLDNFNNPDRPNETLSIPFYGACTIGSKAFHWTRNLYKVHFWGKAPTSFPADAFSNVSTGSYERRIAANKVVDEAGWIALRDANAHMRPCTDEEKAREDYPGDNGCFGTFTGSGGCVYWLCWESSPWGKMKNGMVLIIR